MKEKLGSNIFEIERKLREHKKLLNWNYDTKPHRWNSEEAKIANKKGHHWNSEEAKLAAKKRWEKDLNRKIEKFNQENTWIKDKFNPLLDVIIVFKDLKK